MSLNIYVYDLAIKVAIMAASEDEALTKLEQGQAQQISMEQTLVSTTEVPN
jgi:hypothetical protein